MDRYDIYSSTGTMTPILEPTAPAEILPAKTPQSIAKWVAGGLGVLLALFLAYQLMMWVAGMLLPLAAAAIVCALLAGAIYKGRALTSFV
jgi:hypothetical protein